MAAVRDYQAPSVPFPAELPTAHAPVLEFVDEARLRQQVARSLPVENLLAWLHQHHANLHDATLLRLFHELQHETDWQCARAEQAEQIDLQHIRVTHYPLALRAPTESARGVGA